MCTNNKHELFVDYENNALILRCRKCRCKWRVKRQISSYMLAVILFLSGATVLIGFLTAQRWLIPLGIILSSRCSLLDYYVFLVLKHLRLNWSRIQGEQIAFDNTER